MEEIFKEKLYHGTCSINLNLSEDELEYKRNICISTADICYLFLKNKMKKGTQFFIPPSGKEEAFYDEMCDIAWSLYNSYKTGNCKYQYGNYYLTTNLESAKSSWSQYDIFGEIGERAKRLLLGCELYEDFHLCLKKHELDIIEKFKNLPRDSKHVVIEFSNVPKKILLSEGGYQVNWPLPDSNCFRVKKEDTIVLFKYKTDIIYLK